MIIPPDIAARMSPNFSNTLNEVRALKGMSDAVDFDNLYCRLEIIEKRLEREEPPKDDDAQNLLNDLFSDLLGLDYTSMHGYVEGGFTMDIDPSFDSMLVKKLFLLQRKLTESEKNGIKKMPDMAEEQDNSKEVKQMMANLLQDTADLLLEFESGKNKRTTTKLCLTSLKAVFEGPLKHVHRMIVLALDSSMPEKHKDNWYCAERFISMGDMTPGEPGKRKSDIRFFRNCIAHDKYTIEGDLVHFGINGSLNDKEKITFTTEELTILQYHAMRKMYAFSAMMNILGFFSRFYKLQQSKFNDVNTKEDY